MPTEEEVREQLKEVVDPELNVNIVDLGLVYEIDVEGEEVYVKMTLTTKGCPLHRIFNELVTKELKKLEDIESVNVELTFEPEWKPEMMSDEARDDIGHIPGQQPF